MNNRVALVTGAAQGIGQAIAIALAAQGAKLILFDLKDCSETARRIGGGARSVVGNVAEETDVLALFAGIASDEKRLDIAVSCAGFQLIRPILETSVEDLDQVIGVKLKGTFFIRREAAHTLKNKPFDGRIINIASELAYIGRARFSAYCATKGAILSLTRSWARELAPHILVNAVAPGPTDTAMLDADENQRAEELAGVPLGRIASPAEIAASVTFLAGPDGAFFTGQCISPNGGAAMF